MVAQIFSQISQIHMTPLQGQQIIAIIAIVMFGWAARQVWNIIEGKQNECSNYHCLVIGHRFFSSKKYGCKSVINCNKKDVTNIT